MKILAQNKKFFFCLITILCTINICARPLKVEWVIDHKQEFIPHRVGETFCFDGSNFIVNFGHKTSSITPETGKTNWEVSIPSPKGVSYCSELDSVIAYGNGIHSINNSNGKINWKSGISPNYVLISDNNIIYANNNANTLFKINAENGEVKKHVLYRSGTMLFADDDRNIYDFGDYTHSIDSTKYSEDLNKIETNKQTVKTSLQGRQEHYKVADYFPIFKSDDKIPKLNWKKNVDFLCQITKSDGSFYIWEKPSMVNSDNLMIVGDVQGYINIETSTGWYREHSGGNIIDIISNDNNLLLIATDKKLVCYSGANTKLLNSTWPTYRFNLARTGYINDKTAPIYSVKVNGLKYDEKKYFSAGDEVTLTIKSFLSDSNFHYELGGKTPNMESNKFINSLSIKNTTVFNVIGYNKYYTTSYALKPMNFRFKEEIKLKYDHQDKGELNIDPNKPNYYIGDIVKFKIAPNHNYYHLGWTGDLVDYKGAGYIFNKANFNVEPIFGVKLKLNSISQGKIKSNARHSGYLLTNEAQTLEAVPEAGFKFFKWAGDLITPEIEQNNKIKITFSEQKLNPQISAIFVNDDSQLILSGTNSNGLLEIKTNTSDSVEYFYSENLINWKKLDETTDFFHSFILDEKNSGCIVAIAEKQLFFKAIKE
jgi:ribosomal protein L21E